MTRATMFLMGAADPKGRTVETILEADDLWLEDRHDWVQWAFPNREPSLFNPDAPVWSSDEAAALPEEALANLRRLVRRYQRFLLHTDWWRHRSDHNHQRITRVLLCLCDAGLREEALAFHRFVESAPEPGPTSRSYWRAAIERDEA